MMYHHTIMVCLYQAGIAQYMRYHHTIMVCFQAGVECNYVLYAILSGGQYCICNNVRRTVLHMQSCPPGRFYIVQLCPPDTLAYAVLSAPMQNCPCSKLNALGRRNTFAIF